MKILWKDFPTKMIRTSLALGPGEVGAPVFDLNGRFINYSCGTSRFEVSFLLPAKACKGFGMTYYYPGRLNMVGLELHPQGK